MRNLVFIAGTSILVVFGHRVEADYLTQALHFKSFKMCDIPQAGIKHAGLPLWGTVVYSPDNVVLLEFTFRVHFNLQM